MKVDERLFRTGMNLNQIKYSLSSCLSGADVNPMEYGPMDVPADFAVVALKRPLLLRLKRVEIQVGQANDELGGMIISLSATGHGALGTMWYGAQSVNFGGSVSWRDEMVAALRTEDPELTEIFD